MLSIEIRQAASEYASTITADHNMQLLLVSAFLAGVQYHQHSPVQIQAKESDIPLFSLIWQLYDRKDAKRNAEKAWAKLSDKEKQQAFAHIPPYVKAHPDKKYRPMLATYLNQKRFLDEEIVSNEDITTYDKRQQQRLAGYASTIANIEVD